MQQIAKLEAKKFNLDEVEDLSNWPSDQVITYEKNKKIVGALRWEYGHPLFPNKKNIVYLNSIVVAKSKQGIGTKLMAKFHKKMKGKIILLVVDTKWDSDSHLINWYKKLGYSITKLKPKNPNGILMKNVLI
jgi:ribosomal protein S18 acetylase RimI-like enzyme